MVVRGENDLEKCGEMKRESGVWLMLLPIWMMWVLFVGLWGEMEGLSEDQTGAGFLVWWVLCMLSFGIVSGLGIYVGVC